MRHKFFTLPLPIKPFLLGLRKSGRSKRLTLYGAKKMNMISTGAFLPEMDASNKQETMAEKFARVWEKKNSKVARAGGFSLMALSLAACGSSSDTAAVTPVTPTPEPDPEPVAPVAPTVNNYTLETTDDYIAGKVGENDVVVASQTTYNDGDAIVDADATDADTLTVTATADISATATVAGIETVNFNLDAFTAAGGNAAIFEVAGDNITASTFNVDNVKEGSGIVSATLTALTTGSTVNFSDDFTTVNVEADDNAELVLTSAATSVTANGTGGGLLTKATMSSSAATAATFNSDTDGTIDATTSAADMVIAAAAATTVVASSAGSIDANGTDLTAATSVNLTAVDEIDVGLEAATTATFSAGGTTASTIDDAAGDTLTSVSLSGNGTAHTFDLKDSEGVATVTITGDQAVTVEMDGSDIDGLTDNALTVTDGSTATSTLSVTTAAGDMDLSAAAVDVINIGVDNNAKAATVASGAAVTFSVAQTSTTIDGSDAGAATNTVAVTLDDADLTNSAAVDVGTLVFTDIASATIDVSVDANTTADDSIITNITGTADNTSVTINAGALGVELGAAGATNLGTGNLVINSDGAVTLGGNTISATSFTHTGSGAVTWTNADSSTVVTTVTGGGDDAITIADTSASSSTTTGAGDDTITLGVATTAAKVTTIDGGDDFDTVTLADGGLDFGAGTLTMTNVERILLDDDAADGYAGTVAAATLDGQDYIITADQEAITADVTIKVGTTTSLDLSQLLIDGAKLTKADSFIIDYNAAASAVTVSGSGMKNTITGSAFADTLTGGTSDDVIKGGAGADIMVGGTGDNTFQFNSGDVAAGETVTFNTATTATAETFDIDTSTDMTGINAGALLTGLDVIDLASGITGSFAAAQLTGLTLAANGVNGGATETLSVTGTSAADTIDMSNTTMTDVTLAISGGDGNDTITGGVGINSVTGGTGDDTFVFANTTGTDVIVDFTTADDVMHFDQTVFALETANASLADAGELITIATAAGTDNNAVMAAGVDVILLTDTTGHTAASLVADLDGGAGGDAILIYFDSGTSLTTMAYDNDVTDATAATVIATFTNVANTDIAASFVAADFIMI